MKQLVYQFIFVVVALVFLLLVILQAQRDQPPVPTPDFPLTQETPTDSKPIEPDYIPTEQDMMDIKG